MIGLGHHNADSGGFEGTVVPLLRDHPVVHTDGGPSIGVVLHQGWAEFQ